MMVAGRRIAVIASAVAALSCTHGTGTPAPTPSTNGPPVPVTTSTTTTTSTTSTTTTSLNDLPPALRRRFIPRDSLAKLRSVYVAEVMQKIAGRENQPAEQVFKNVQVLKGITAAELVQKMEKDYSEALSWNCTNCHRLANEGNFASDTSADKRRARFMQQMQNDINGVELPKLYPRDTPKVTCATCHRGYNEPPPAQYLLPERGQPGGLPFPRLRGTPPR
jgi:hypothetical protein